MRTRTCGCRRPTATKPGLDTVEHFAKLFYVMVEVREIVKLGKPATLYRIVTPDGWSSEWHWSLDTTLKRYQRHERKRLAGGA